MDNAQLVREYRAFSSFREEIVHQTQKWCREKEGNRVVPVPPLHQRILDSGVYGIAFPKADWDYYVIKEMENRNRNDRCNVEPQRHIHMTLASIKERHEKVGSEESEPHNGNSDIDRPF